MPVKIFARPNLRVTDKARLREIFDTWRRHLTETAPFAVKQFRELRDITVLGDRLEATLFPEPEPWKNKE